MLEMYFAQPHNAPKWVQVMAPEMKHLFHCFDVQTLFIENLREWNKQ